MKAESNLDFRPFEKQLKRKSFDCGVESLNYFLLSLASQWDRKGLAKTTVACLKGTDDIVGYYSLSAYSINFLSLPITKQKGLPSQIPIPAVLLGRLAVDRHFQAQGFGKELLIHGLFECLRVAKNSPLGVHGVVTEAVDETAKRFYMKYGFVPFFDQPMTLFYAIKNLRNLLSD